MGKAYYVGGCRVMVDGVPIRLARKPSAHNLADLRAHERERELDNTKWLNPRERAADRVKRSINAVNTYAETLGISVKAARARIEAQRLHELANPMRDLSLEYDL
jgi:protease II